MAVARSEWEKLTIGLSDRRGENQSLLRRSIVNEFLLDHVGFVVDEEDLLVLFSFFMAMIGTEDDLLRLRGWIAIVVVRWNMQHDRLTHRYGVCRG